MLLLIRLGLRNLLRQKRRNLFLGGAIAFGIMVLVISNSFTHGLTDLMLNKLFVYSQGHIKIASTEKNNRSLSIIRDKNRIMNIITNTVDNIEFTQEEMMIFSRAVGNGKSDNLPVVGVVMDSDFLTFPVLKEGSFDDLTNGTLENPILIGETHSKSLNVKPRDKINISFRTLYGQSYTARLTVAAIVSAANPMMTYTAFIDVGDMKKMLGFKPHESGGIKIVFKNVRDPKKVITMADELHLLLTPRLMSFYGDLSYSGKKAKATAFTVLQSATNSISGHISVKSGSVKKFFNRKKNMCMITTSLARTLGAGPGDIIQSIYKTQYGIKRSQNKHTVAAVFTPKKAQLRNVMFLNEESMYKTYYPALPQYTKNIKQAESISTNSALHTLLAPEWKLLKRIRSTKELTKRAKETAQRKPKMATMDISTMYESFDIINQIGVVLMMISLVGVIILFFIILIGVFNTLRMTIRERTREIGTVRAIGMQSTDVKRMFIIETSLLALFSALFGIAAGLIIIKLIGLIPITTESAFTMFLYEKHIHFMPKASFIITYIIAIILISALTAYFPSRKAARLTAADALRHYE
ncbi:FtsX-like permease family protein [Spirochaetota bacterium]